MRGRRVPTGVLLLQQRVSLLPPLLPLMLCWLLSLQLLMVKLPR